MGKSALKAIIIAAGRGRRLKDISSELPKCLAVSWEGRSLFERQIAAFRECGIDDIVVVRGWQGEKFTRPDIRYVWNKEYASNNILASLMCAREEIRGNVLVSYSDIWFEPSIVRSLLNAGGDMTIAVDSRWQGHYHGRSEHPLGEAEVAAVGPDGRLKTIGKIFKPGVPLLGEFIGMMRLRPAGSETFRKAYETVEREFAGKPFQHAKTFQNAYLTDMLQYLADAGVAVRCECIQGAWREIDTVQDYENLMKSFSYSGSAPVGQKEE